MFLHNLHETAFLKTPVKSSFQKLSATLPKRFVSFVVACRRCHALSAIRLIAPHQSMFYVLFYCLLGEKFTEGN